MSSTYDDTYDDIHDDTRAAQPSQAESEPLAPGTRMAGRESATEASPQPKRKAQTRPRAGETAARGTGGTDTPNAKQPARTSRANATTRAKRAARKPVAGEGTQENETMPSGRERNILRWELHAYLLQQQLNQIDEELAGHQGPLTASEEDHRARMENARITLQKQLDALGPSPKAKMG